MILRHTKQSCLPLLPSGPGGVHSVLLHRAQPPKKCKVRGPPSLKLRRAAFAHANRWPASRSPPLPWRRWAKAGGEGGIRTHGAVASTRALQARRIVHSRTSPRHNPQNADRLTSGKLTRETPWSLPPSILRPVSLSALDLSAFVEKPRILARSPKTGKMCVPPSDL